MRVKHIKPHRNSLKRTDAKRTSFCVLGYYSVLGYHSGCLVMDRFGRLFYKSSLAQDMRLHCSYNPVFHGKQSSLLFYKFRTDLICFAFVCGLKWVYIASETVSPYDRHFKDHTTPLSWWVKVGIITER